MLPLRLTAAVLFAGFLFPVPSAHAAGETLPALVELALKDNPAIKAAAFRVKALHSSPGHNWSLEAPQIGVEFYQAPVRSFPDPIRNQAEIDYSIQQAFPFPGKIGSRIDAEHRHAEMSEAGLEGLKRKVIRDVKTGYYELYLLDRRMEINREGQALMNRLVEIARRQYEVGIGRQADILRAQAEQTILKSDSILLGQSRQAAQGMLNALLNRKIGETVSVRDTLEPAEMAWAQDRLGPLLEESHPELQEMKASIRMREAEKSVARKDYLPDFMVGGAYKDMLRMPSGTHGGELNDYWSVMVSMNVPLAFWSLPRYKAAVEQGQANLDAAEQEYLDRKNTVSARAQAAWLKAMSGRELARVSRNVLVPQAKQALESTLISYQGGKSEFMAVLDAYRVSLMARENSEMALMRLLSSQADLEEAVGLGLDAIQSRLSAGDGK
ncbi:MAG: hypothetical protein JWP91_4270 [Fibrobacteres bacterium]|nr:hypothetical protein [Fibrobacterota bacterium]